MNAMTAIQSKIIDLRQTELTNAEIAERLGIELDTVKHHVKKLRKVGVDMPSRSVPQTGAWTAERVEKLKALWAEGNSAGIIAGLLSRDYGHTISRSAVIGKVWRLGLSGRATTQQRRYIVQRGPGHKPRAPRKPIAPKLWGTPPDGRTDIAEAREIEMDMPTRVSRRPVPASAPAAEIVPLPSAEVWTPLPNVEPVTMADIGLTHCRWPVEDGTDRRGVDSLYCGADAPVGEPYCPTHANQAMPRHRRVA